MLFRLLLVIFCSSLFSLGSVHAKANRSSKVSKRSYSKSKRSKKMINLRFTPDWYFSLTKKQQKVYLKVLSDIVYKSAKRSASFDNSFWKYLIEKAEAEDLGLNIGYIYDKDVGFQNFLSNLTFKYEEPGKSEPQSLNQCSGSQSPCAIYTCLKKDSSGNPVLCCGTNSTPSCVAEGRKPGNSAVLFETLGRCRANRGTARGYCDTVMTLLQESSTHVHDWCKDKMNQGYCKDGVAALTAAGIKSGSPVPVAVPKDPSCQPIAKELKKRQKAYNDSSPGNTSARNNAFWEDISSIAQKMCGISETNVVKRLGVCDIKDMGAPGKGIKGTKRISTRRPPVGSPPHAFDGYNACVIAKVDERMGNRHKEERSKLDSEKSGKTLSAHRKEEDDLIKKQNKERRDFAEQVRKNPNCSYSKEVINPVTGNSRKYSDIANFDAIIKQIKDGKASSMDNFDKNQFMSVTGMQPEAFKATFCKSNYGEFKKSFDTAVKKSPFLKINPNLQSQLDMRDQAKTAQKRMMVCSENLKSAEESGCELGLTPTVAGLADTSDENPIMVQNKTTGKCSLAVKQKFYDGDIMQNADGTTMYNQGTGEAMRQKKSVIFLDPVTSKPIELHKTPDEFAQGHNMFVYSCLNAKDTPGAGDAVPGKEPTYNKKTGEIEVDF